MNPRELWTRYKQYLCTSDVLGLRLDISRMMFAGSFFDQMAEPMARALQAMESLEGGCIANIDENRMVGHYWLREPQLASNEQMAQAIRQTVSDIKTFAGDVHSGRITPQQTDGFYVVLIVGIGGSALGPQFVSDALGSADDPMLVRFIDNTDPNGIDRTLAELDDQLERTLTIVISKSGGTKETRNGMMEVADAYQRRGLNFPAHAVAVTGEGSALDRQALDEGWLRTFPMWDWVGGRTSECSAVGLLPAALQGFDIDRMLAGARECDVVTRNRNIFENPAALLALMWHYAGDGHGQKDMVVLPYADRLLLLGRYLQQLVMESLGKRVDRDGREALQGLTVYGNKGSTDQHAYVQQLRDGLDRFFATFVEVLSSRRGKSIRVEDDVTSGDYLHGFLHGTRTALYEQGRESVTITIDDVTPYTIGVLIALFERAVGLYAELVNVNAYHQPGVEAGKKAAESLINLQRKVLRYLRSHPEADLTAEQMAQALDLAEEAENIHHLLQHVTANRDHNVSRMADSPAKPFETRYRASAKRPS